VRSGSTIARPAWWNGRTAGRWIALALGAAAAVVMTIGIGTPWPWSDEGATFLAVQRTWQELAVLWQSRDAPWVPYYYLAKAWATVVHTFAPGLSTVVAVRLLSAVAATGAVLGLYALVARNAGRLAGVFAAVLLISLPGFNRYAQEARGYSLLALAATVSWLLCDRWLHPARVATLTGTAMREGRPTGPSGPVGSGAAYAVSLAAVAAVQTFGLFQWPAHLLAVAVAPAQRSARARRVAGLALLGLVAAALAGAQVAASLLHGTGPSHPQAARVVSPMTIMVQLARGMSYTSHPEASIAILVLAAVGALSRVAGRRAFPINLLIWLVVPLSLEIVLGAVHTNLFRLRYWIAFLPPLAALAGIGALTLATASARLVGRLSGGRAAGLALVTAVFAALLGVQLAATLQPQQQLRAIDGHGENLTRVMAGITQERAAHPGLIIAISSATGSGIIAASDPPVLVQNPLRHISATAPTVYTTRTAAHLVRQSLAGGHDVLWIHRGTEDPAVAAQHLPHALAQLHPTVLWSRSAGLDWTLVLLRT
jgi:uncharacterized membrane protein